MRGGGLDRVAFPTLVLVILLFGVFTVYTSVAEPVYLIFKGEALKHSSSLKITVSLGEWSLQIVIGFGKWSLQIIIGLGKSSVLGVKNK